MQSKANVPFSIRFQSYVSNGMNTNDNALTLSYTRWCTSVCLYSTSFDRFIDTHFFSRLLQAWHISNKIENRVRCTLIVAILDYFEPNKRSNVCMRMLLNNDSNEYTSFLMHNEWIAMRQSTQKAFVSTLYSIKTFTVIIHIRLSIVWTMLMNHLTSHIARHNICSLSTANVRVRVHAHRALYSSQRKQSSHKISA